MLTDKTTQIEILTNALKRVFKEHNIDGSALLKTEFKTTITNKYNSYKYPMMRVSVTTQ